MPHSTLFGAPRLPSKAKRQVSSWIGVENFNVHNIRDIRVNKKYTSKGSLNTSAGYSTPMKFRPVDEVLGDFNIQ